MHKSFMWHRHSCLCTRTNQGLPPCSDSRSFAFIRGKLFLICAHLRKSAANNHFPFHTGFRFSIHAAIPSFTSSVRINSSR